MASSNRTLTAIAGIRVGHAELAGAPSGCTVVLLDRAAAAGVDVRGGAPGTYGTDSLQPVNLVERIHGLFFSGGSAFGLDVAQGVRRYLSEREVGFDSGYERIPIVCGAVIFDLGINRSGRYPDADLGYRACLAAGVDPVAEGCVGAGLGATVGKLHGLPQAMKTGLGSVRIEGADGLVVAALMVVNAFGDVLDPDSGRIVSGCRNSPTGRELLGMERAIHGMNRLLGFPEGANTTIGVVATNAALGKTQLTKVARMAHDGMARSICPAHTMYDGDTIFALSCGDVTGVEVSVVGTLAARATALAILRGAEQAGASHGLPAATDLVRHSSELP